MPVLLFPGGRTTAAARRIAPDAQASADRLRYHLTAMPFRGGLEIPFLRSLRPYPVPPLLADPMPLSKAKSGLQSLSAIRRRSEEHTSELQSLMRISYAVFCLKTKKNNTHIKQIRPQ